MSETLTHLPMDTAPLDGPEMQMPLGNPELLYGPHTDTIEGTASLVRETVLAHGQALGDPRAEERADLAGALSSWGGAIAAPEYLSQIEENVTQAANEGLKINNIINQHIAWSQLVLAQEALEATRKKDEDDEDGDGFALAA